MGYYSPSIISAWKPVTTYSAVNMRSSYTRRVTVGMCSNLQGVLMVHDNGTVTPATLNIYLLILNTV